MSDNEGSRALGSSVRILSVMTESLRPIHFVQLFLLGVCVIAFILAPHTKTEALMVLSSPVLEALPPHTHGDEDSVADIGHGVLLFSYATTTEDMWVNDIALEIHNAPPANLHHLSLTSMLGEDPECPGTKAQSDIIAIGQDTPFSFHFDAPYGMFIKKGTVLEMSTMLHNPKEADEVGSTLYDVSVSVSLSGTHTKPKDFKAVELLRVAVQDTPYCDKNPRGPGFTVPPHQTTYEEVPSEKGPDRGRYTMPRAGTIISGYGHIHGWDGGKSVSLFVNGSLTHTWETEHLSKVGRDGREWQTPYVPLKIPVKAGDVLTVSSIYTNPSEHEVHNAMGAARLFFAEE